MHISRDPTKDGGFFLLFYQYHQMTGKENSMSRYFMQDTPLADLERFMMTPPKPPHPNDEEGTLMEQAIRHPTGSQKSPDKESGMTQ